MHFQWGLKTPALLHEQAENGFGGYFILLRKDTV